MVPLGQNGPSEMIMTMSTIPDFLLMKLLKFVEIVAISVNFRPLYYFISNVVNTNQPAFFFFFLKRGWAEDGPREDSR
jgi:hypothetical protein